MLAKHYAFFLAASLASLAMPAGVQAFPDARVQIAPIGRPYVEVDYYTRSYARNDDYYDYRGPYYDRIEDTPLGLLLLPGQILGTALGTIAEGLSGDPYANPNFADPFYAPFVHHRYAYDSGRDYWRRDVWNSGRFYGSGYYYGSGGSSEWRYSSRTPRHGNYEDNPYYREFPRSRPFYNDIYNDRAYYTASFRPHPYESPAYDDYGGSYRSGGLTACEREFRSFEPETGTYINAYGERVFCPYLHP